MNRLELGIVKRQGTAIIGKEIIANVPAQSGVHETSKGPIKVWFPLEGGEIIVGLQDAAAQLEINKKLSRGIMMGRKGNGETQLRPNESLAAQIVRESSEPVTVFQANNS